jgi:hypothetical protein
MQMNRLAVRRDSWASIGIVVALALVAPAAASAAAARPEARTLGVTSITPTTATVSGTVNPNEAATTYFFQYGTTTLYGANTTETAAGAGNKRVAVNAALSALAPDTRYHYRLIARNAKGLVKGVDRSFRTRKQPLGVTLAATPNPVRFGGSTTLGGTLTGTGNAGRQVVLQANPFPYVQGFQQVGNAQVTDANGNFAFPILGATLNTQYQVQMPAKPEVVSPILLLGVSVRVSTHVSDRNVTRGQKVRFSGRIRPAVDGSKINIQRLKGGEWRTLRRTVAKHSSSSASRYSKRITIHRGGKYRVWVGAEGQYSASNGKTVKIKSHR